jgi:hypothetical protein
VGEEEEEEGGLWRVEIIGTIVENLINSFTM